jgi:hypothetical protein
MNRGYPQECRVSPRRTRLFPQDFSKKERMIEAAVENIQAKRKALTEASGLIKGGQANEVKRESD